MKPVAASLFVLTLLLFAISDVAAQEAAQEAAAPEPDHESSPHWPSPEKVAEHEEEVEWYRGGRLDSLRKPESWLSLVGLHWLSEGTTTLGSGEDMDLRLPDSMPAFVGELTETVSEGGAASGRATVLTPAEGVEIRVDGVPATGPVELRRDTEGEPTQVEVGSVVFYAIDRRDKTAIRVKDRQAKALTEFQGLEFYPTDWRWRIEGRYLPYEEGKEIQVPSVLGGSDAAEIPGAIEFERDGETYRLDVLPGGEDSLFVSFGDRTNGDTTYGGGRFLYIDAPPASNRPGTVTIDFNKSYSPPCVFSPWATCPLPPSQNRLSLAVEAGEKMYTGYTEGSH